MSKFLSEDWIKQYQERWNAEPELTSGLKRMDATMKYYVQGAEKDAVYIQLQGGRAVAAGIAGAGKHDFEMWATRADWKEIASGALGPKKAMALRKLKFKGSMLTAMRYIGPFGRSLEMMGEVQTEW